MLSSPDFGLANAYVDIERTGRAGITRAKVEGQSKAIRMKRDETRLVANMAWTWDVESMSHR